MPFVRYSVDLHYRLILPAFIYSYTTDPAGAVRILFNVRTYQMEYPRSHTHNVARLYRVIVSDASEFCVPV